MMHGDEYTIRLFPLGGLGEVGMNCMLVDLGGERIIIDCGVTFPETDAFGVDVFLPNWSLLLEGEPISGIFLTHGHEDHIGGLPYLIKELLKRDRAVPIYGTRLTLAMLEHKLRERDLLGEVELLEVG